MNDRRRTPTIEIAIGREVRLYHAYVTTAPAKLDAPATLTVDAGPQRVLGGQRALVAGRHLDPCGQAGDVACGVDVCGGSLQERLDCDRLLGVHCHTRGGEGQGRGVRRLPCPSRISSVSSVAVLPSTSNDTRLRSPIRATAVGCARVITSMPSRVRISVSRCASTASVRGKTVAALCSTVTLVSKRANNWLNSSPSAPAPITINDAGNRSR